MIVISKDLNLSLRKRSANKDVALLSCGRKSKEEFPNCKIFPERGRFYIVNTFKCNNSCEFCSFHKVEIDECGFRDLSEQIRYGFSLKTPYDGYSISITGGEPLIKPDRLYHILCSLGEYQSKIRWIGFGTNGTLAIPDFLINDFGHFEFRFYVSRHHYRRDVQEKIFNHDCINTGQLIARLSGHRNIKFALTCNLIGSYVDNLVEIKRYLNWARSVGVTNVVFRELNAISDEQQSYGDAETERYLGYYKERLVDMRAICSQIETDSDFSFVEQSVRPFIYHEIWKYQDMSVTFRGISEENLVHFNQNDDEIDELVLWPDGRLCGCWDYEMKVLKDV